MIGPGIIERAFELAHGGTCATLQDVRRHLIRENYTNIDAHLAGFSIPRQLKGLLKSGPKPEAGYGPSGLLPAIPAPEGVPGTR